MTKKQPKIVIVYVKKTSNHIELKRYNSVMLPRRYHYFVTRHKNNL